VGEYYDKMMSGVGETLDSIDKEKAAIKKAKVTDKQRKEFTKKHGKDHGATDRVIKSYFKIQERKRLKAEKDAEKAKNQKVTPTEEKKADKKKAAEKAKETPVGKTTNKKKVITARTGYKPSATEKPPTINRSKKGGEKTTATKTDTGGHAGRTKTEKVTPTTDKTDVPTKDRSTKLRERTTAAKTDTGGLGGRTKTETDVEPETTTETPQEVEKPKVEVEKPKAEKPKAEKPKAEKPKVAGTLKPGRKIPKFGEKQDATAEFRKKPEGKLPKSGTKVERPKNQRM
jgi:hypothetical protein